MKNIYIVDRDDGFPEIMQLILNEDRPGEYEFFGTTSGLILLHKIKKETPDVVFVGVRLPDYDYLDLIEEIRRSYPDLPIILNTSREDLVDHPRASFATLWFKKFVDSERVEKAIAEAIERHSYCDA